MLVSVFSQVEPRLVSFFLFFLLRIICIRYLLAIWEKDSISLWIFKLGICRPWRSLTIVVCIVSLISIVVIMGGNTIHPSWDRSGRTMAYLRSFRLVTSVGNLSLQ